MQKDDRYGHSSANGGDDGKYRQDGQGHQQRQQAGNGQKQKRIQAHAGQSVDFLVYFHGADFGGISRSRAAGNDGGRHDGADLGDHGKGDRRRNKDMTAVFLQLHGSDKGGNQ